VVNHPVHLGLEVTDFALVQVGEFVSMVVRWSFF
jgi:hypothetical protein